jgi:hypothetical protein
MPSKASLESVRLTLRLLTAHSAMTHEFAKQHFFASWPVCNSGSHLCIRCLQAAYEPESLPSIEASDTAPDAWRGDLLSLGIFEDAITTASMGNQERSLRGLHRPCVDWTHPAAKPVAEEALPILCCVRALARSANPLQRSVSLLHCMSLHLQMTSRVCPMIRWALWTSTLEASSPKWLLLVISLAKR